MKVLGIDPGTVKMGIGIVDDSGGRYRLVHYDVLKMSSSENICVRLGKIFKFIKEQIKEHNVDAVAIEDVFMSVNARSALKLGQGRGVAIAAAIDAGKEVFEYTPREIKKSISTYGGADKTQVAYMIGILLGVKDIKSNDATDALAISICHLNTVPMRQREARA